ncbi:MAG: hypothetical protein AAGK97_12195, partial [Bacteroidota bacterium]
MIELNPLIAISKEIRAWLETKDKKSAKEKAKMKFAIEALSTAILETKSYVRNGFANRILEKEEQIRKLWNKAHIEFREIDSDLAMRCFLKAE